MGAIRADQIEVGGCRRKIRGGDHRFGVDGDRRELGANVVQDLLKLWGRDIGQHPGSEDGREIDGGRVTFRCVDVVDQPLNLRSERSFGQAGGRRRGGVLRLGHPGRNQTSAQEHDEQQDRGASLQKVELHGVFNPSLWNTVPGWLTFRLTQMIDADVIVVQSATVCCQGGARSQAPSERSKDSLFVKRSS